MCLRHAHQRKESAVENEFVPKELEERARGLGFGDRPYVHLIGKEPNHSHFSTGSGSIDWGITLEQLERWIWKEYRELFPDVSQNRQCKYDVYSYFQKKYIGTFDDPLTARLAGVERVIEILEEQQSIPPMEKGER